jgi:hypothetical protein
VQTVFALTVVILPTYAVGLEKESTLRIICYALIGASPVIGMPALDGILR